MSDPHDTSDWLALGRYEVLAADLEGAGAGWADVFPAEFAEPLPDFLLQELPRSGWRPITVRNRGDGYFAAPKDGGWMVASVHTAAHELPRFMGELSVHRPRPDQEARRRGLQLTWSEPLRIAISELDAVTVTLTNTTEVPWSPDPEDHAFVHGHFLDENGQPPERCHFTYGGYQAQWRIDALAPGASAELPVSFGHDDPEPGSYDIEAILVSLNLRSCKGTLEIRAD